MGWLGSAAGLVVGPGRLYAELAVAGVLAVSLGAQTWRLHSEQAEHAEDSATWAKQEAELAGRALAAEQRERAKEQAWNTRLQETVDVATQKIVAADSAASAAVSARDRLLERVSAAAAAGRRARANPAPAGDRAPAADPIGVLADVLGRADAAAGLMAAVADQRGIRGETCERAYESLRK